MRVVVIGSGHVGLVTAATLASIGHEVIGLDHDLDKIAGLQAGHLPFYEPELQELFDAERSSGRLRFAQESADAIPGTDVAFICVGTPGRPTGEPNMLAVERAVHDVSRWASHGMVVVEKSTVPVATSDRVRSILGRNPRFDFDVASNPEFLREGHAVEDSLRPDRILVGADSVRGHEIMRRLYAPLIDAGAKYFATDVPTAELAKHACNAFLSLKISFANGLARVCEASGADVTAVTAIMGSDPRIGPAFLNAGLGYGGSCFPKDLAAFRAQAQRLGYSFGLLDEIERLNEEALEAVMAKIVEALWNLEEKRIVLLGLAFKPDTDDVREAPALRLARRLIDAGANVVGCDPKANANAVREVPDLEVADDVYVAAEAAHCLVVCTEWQEFLDLDLELLGKVMGVPIMVDGRNLFDPVVVATAGFTYLPTGRPAPGVRPA